MSFRTLGLTPRRKYISALFGLTFFATVVTVSASNILPCPARPHRVRFADAGEDVDLERMAEASQRPIIVANRPARWIQETDPTKS
jgi:cytochrome c oxidase assembly factor 2